MTGTIINAATVLIGSLLGTLLATATDLFCPPDISGNTHPLRRDVIDNPVGEGPRRGIRVVHDERHAFCLGRDARYLKGRAQVLLAVGMAVWDRSSLLECG